VAHGFDQSKELEMYEKEIASDVSGELLNEAMIGMKLNLIW
jgi:hypothetical protein